MKKHCCYSFAICLLILCGWPFCHITAQIKTSLELGPEYKDKHWSFPPTALGFDESGYYFYQTRAAGYAGISFLSFKVSKEKFYLRKFDRSLKPQKLIELELETEGKDETPLRAFYINKHIFLFSTSVDARSRKSVLYVRDIDTKSLKVPAAGRKVCEVNYEGYARNTYINFSFYQSRDTSKVLMVYSKPSIREESQAYGAMLFNDEMIKLWEQDFVLPYEDDLFITRKFRVDNGGNVYLLGKQFFDKPKNRVKGKPNYNFKILSLQPGFEEPEEVTLEVPDLFLVDMHLEILPNGNLVCAGAYTERNMSNPKGLVYLTLDGSTKEVISDSREELSLDMFGNDDDDEKEPKKGSKRKQKKKAERAFYNYDFKDIVLRTDGGAALIGEATYSNTVSRTSTDASGRMTTTTTTYYSHNDIIAINIDPAGQIENASRIRKRQRMAHSNYLLSFALGVSGGSLHFVYNDNIKNSTLNLGEGPALYVPSIFGKSKQVVRTVSLNGAGDISSSQLTTVKESDQFAIPLASQQISPSQLILIFQKGKKRKLGRITFE